MKDGHSGFDSTRGLLPRQTLEPDDPRFQVTLDEERAALRARGNREPEGATIGRLASPDPSR